MKNLTKKPKNKLAKLESELLAAEKKAKRLSKQAAEARQKPFAIERAIHREKLIAHTGGQVKKSCRGSLTEIPDDAVGTLVKVNRTRCLVDFDGDIGDWSLPIDEVIPADQDQGYTISWGGA